MPYARYSFHSLTWIGPDIPLDPTVAKVFEKTPLADVNAFTIPEIRFVCSRSLLENPTMKYALLSSYCLLEDAILGPLETYAGCYRRILSFAASEAQLRPDGIDEVKTCLANHRILDVIEMDPHDTC
jgi:hypothetical protein